MSYKVCYVTFGNSPYSGNGYVTFYASVIEYDRCLDDYLWSLYVVLVLFKLYFVSSGTQISDIVIKYLKGITDVGVL
jgi:hypothetical protein